MKTQTVTTTEEWLVTYTKGGKPHEQLFDNEAEANEAFNALLPRHSRTVVLYNITTQTTKTLQRRY
ncbi:MAG: hypothetical protein EBR82_84060 [Caulobacteraceae bacterium]|nr:hypothetical protein [Caulobacteraceae bacterium]